jgi:plasmid stability protein
MSNILEVCGRCDIDDIVFSMATILIRNLNDSVKAALRQRAAANDRSMEEEARRIIESELRRDRSLAREGLGTRLRQLFVTSGAVGAFDVSPRGSQQQNVLPLSGEESER